MRETVEGEKKHLLISVISILDSAPSTTEVLRPEWTCYTYQRLTCLLHLWFSGCLAKLAEAAWLNKA